jgi:hypothetical protein
MKTRLSLIVSTATALAGAACLEDQKPAPDCGAEGDAFVHGGRGYCIYSGAIIIEGFDCPPLLPFGHESEGILVCSPTDEPPPEGWDGVVDAWQEQQGEPPGDTSQPEVGDTAPLEEVIADTSPPDTSPDDAGGDVGPDIREPLCTSGLAPGQCWSDAQCPSGWVCEGGAIACTPCVDCPEPISGTRGVCHPAATGSALGLLAWPEEGGGGSELPVAIWWVTGAVYGLLECPSYVIEIADPGRGFVAGPAESDCSGLTSLVNEAPIVRPGPRIVPSEDPFPLVRARGSYLQGCSGSSADSCAERIEVLSPEILIHP